MFACAALAALSCGSAALGGQSDNVPPRGPDQLLTPPLLSTMSPLDYFRLKQMAAATIDQKQFSDAEKQLSRLAAAYPYDGEIWHQLGQMRYLLGDLDGTVKALRHAYALGVSHYGEEDSATVARAYARLGQAAAAIHWLSVAFYSQHYRDPDGLLAERIFDPLRGRRDFKSLSEVRPPLAASRSGRMEDLASFAARLTRLRPDLTSTQRVMITERMRRIGTEADRESLDEFAVELQGLHALTGRGHSGSPVMWDATALNGRGLEVLPVDLYLFPEGLFVIGGSGPGAALVGRKVLAFGSIDAANALKRVASLIDRDPGSDMSILWLGPRFLTMPAVLKVLGLSQSVHTSTLRVEAPDGGTETVRLDGTPFRPRPKLYPPSGATSPPPLYLSRVAEPYWVSRLDGQTTYLQFNQIRDGSAESLQAFALRLRDRLNSDGTRNLVVDLRHNNGGDTYSYTELLRTLIGFDVVEGHRIFIISGRSTFSAAQNFLVDVSRLTKAIIVGEPASSPRAGGDEVTFRLPRSGLPAGVAPVIWSLQSPGDDRVWIAPDLPIVLTASDNQNLVRVPAHVFRNRDQARERPWHFVRTKRCFSRCLCATSQMGKRPCI